MKTNRAQYLAKDVLEEFPQVAKDLKQLLQTLDSGQAVDISALPSKRLKSLLQKLFRSLSLEKTKSGSFFLPSGAEPTLQRIGMSLDDDVEEDVYEGPEPPSEVPQNVATENSENPDSRSSPQATHELPKRRVLGPAAPSRDILDAAAAESAEIEADVGAADEDELFIGPTPVEIVAEVGSANDAERFEEVTRILDSKGGNAYDILRVKREATMADLKKSYWKLSLLVHPDKCQHPQAHEAFMVLNKAFKDLQDPSKRSVINQIVDDQQAKEMYEAELKAMREAALWRKLRGEEAHPGDNELLAVNTNERVRDKWMTELPPERQTGGSVELKTRFSRSERGGRGDTSAWTDTPADLARKAHMRRLEGHTQATFTDSGADGLVFQREKPLRTATLIDDHDEKKRAVSLVEKFQDEMRQKKKKKKSSEKESSASNSKGEKKEEPSWQESHPWRPWDREKDLGAGRQPVKWDAKSLKEGLSSKFDTSSRGRNFL